MLKEEFEERIGQEVSSEDYNIIENVYIWYPEDLDKDKIAQLYKIGGMRIMKDLYPTAARILDIEQHLQELHVEKERIMKSVASVDARIKHLCEVKRAFVAGEDRIDNVIMHEALGSLDALDFQDDDNGEDLF